MPNQQYPNGLYLLKQESETKCVDHYGILDIGNRINHSRAGRRRPVVIHQTPPSIRLDFLQDTGTWLVLGRIPDEEAAKSRINTAFKNPAYGWFRHNCEHFARYVATGRFESTQLQAACILAGFGLMALVICCLKKE